MGILIIIITSLFFLTATVFADNNTNVMSSLYNWINTILVIVGLVLFGWYQRYQINILKNESESQNIIISNLERFIGAFDLNKVGEYVSISETVIEKKKEIEYLEFQEKMKEKIDSIESEREKYLDKFLKTESESKNITINYEKLINNSLARNSLFFQFLIASNMSKMVSLHQDITLRYSGLLFSFTNIKSDIIDKAQKDLYEMCCIIGDAIESIDIDNLSDIDKSPIVYDKLVALCSDSNQFGDKLNKIGFEIGTEIKKYQSK